MLVLGTCAYQGVRNVSFVENCGFGHNYWKSP